MADSLENMPQDVISELAKLARDLSENPDTRKDFLRLTKKVRKDVPIPEVETEDKVNAALAKGQEELQKLRDEMKSAEAKLELDKRRDRVKKNHGLNDEQVTELEKFMLENKQTDHDKAADYWKWMKQSAEPTAGTQMPQVFDKSTRDALKPYWNNATQAAREAGYKALADLRKGRVQIQ